MKQLILHTTGLLVFVLAQFVNAGEVVSAKNTVTGMWHVYAPTVYTYKGKKRMIMGGWIDKQAQDKKSDVLYYSELANGKWTNPADNPIPVPGYHVNDPSVIQPYPNNTDGRQNWLYMYYTALNDKYVGNDILKYNHVHFASSVDGGKSWTHHGAVIGQRNYYWGASRKYLDLGAWAPSAIKVGNEIHLYFHTNQHENYPVKTEIPVVLRLRFALDGHSRIRGAQRVYFPGNSGVNVDVSKQNGKYVLLLNKGLNTIHRYIGNNGLYFWKASYDNDPLVNAGNNQVLTPHAVTTANNRYDLFFGWATEKNNTCTDWWVKAGFEDFRCSGSISNWQMKNR